MGQTVHVVPAVKAVGLSSRKAELRELWREAFHDSEPYMDFYFQWAAERSHIFIANQDGVLASMLYCNPYRLCAGEQEIEAFYMVGVATKEKYRRRGLMRKLMLEAFDWMWQQKTPFCYLRPAKEIYYTPFGFVTIQQLSMCGMEREAFLQLSGVSRWSELSEAEQAETVAWSNHVLKQKNDLFTKRTMEYMKERQAEMASEGGDIFVLRFGTNTKAVLFSMWEREKNCYVIEDAVSATEEGASDASMVETIPLMVRILHLESFLSGLKAEKEETFELHIKDELLPENTGGYRVTTAKENSKVERILLCEEKSVSIEMFTTTVFGEQAEQYGYSRLHIYEIV